MLTDRWLRLFPLLALVAVVCAAWYWERSFRSVRAVAIASAVIVVLSLLVILLNPGVYFSVPSQKPKSFTDSFRFPKEYHG